MVDGSVERIVAVRAGEFIATAGPAAKPLHQKQTFGLMSSLRVYSGDRFWGILLPNVVLVES